MRIKELFTVPAGEKVTEKIFGRVLVSSLCSILLCMGCLVGTTWAWFTVSIENTENIIEIGEPGVKLSVQDSPFVSGSELAPGSYDVIIEHANEDDDLNKKSTLYVTIPLNGTDAVYTTLGPDNNYCAELTVEVETQCAFAWQVSWFPPANAAELTESTIKLTAEEAAAEPTDDSADAEQDVEQDVEQDIEPGTEPGTEPGEEPENLPEEESEETSGEADDGEVNDVEVTEPVDTTPAEEGTEGDENTDDTEPTE